MYKGWWPLGSGCGAIGSVVDSDTRGPRFETSHRQNFSEHLSIVIIRKDENKRKRGREWPI